MKLLTVVSDSHRVLYENWFLPSLPTDEIVQTHYIGDTGAGEYQTDGWKTGVMAKLGLVCDFCHDHPDEIFVLSDVDIQFFPGFALARLEWELESSGRDVLFQKERSDAACQEVNTGFYVARATPWFCRLMESALQLAAESGERNDQNLLNRLLVASVHREKWGHLPSCYYARSHGFPPPARTLLHHANMTASVEGKLQQLRRVRCWVEGGICAKTLSMGGELLSYLREGKLATMILRRVGWGNPRGQE